MKAVFGNKVDVKIAGNLPRRKNAGELHGRAGKNSDGLTVISIARIAPEKNTLGALRILRSVKCNTDAHFWGTVYDEDYFQLCKEEVNRLPKHCPLCFLWCSGIFSGARSFERGRCDAIANFGENFGHVILESLQAGTPGRNSR